MFYSFKTAPQKSSATVDQPSNQNSYQGYIQAKVKSLEIVRAALGEFSAAKAYEFSAVDQKLNFCRFLAESESTKSSEQLDEQLPTLSSLWSEFQHLVDDLYLNPHIPSYRLLGILEDTKSQTEPDSVQAKRLQIAIKICENKIAFLSAQLKMLQLQLTDLLGIKWFEYNVTEQLKAERKKLQHFSTFSFKYEDKKFVLEIDKNNIAEPISASQQVEFEQLIEDLITLCGDCLSIDENRGTVFDKMLTILINRTKDDLERNKFNFADFMLALQNIVQDKDLKELVLKYQDIMHELYRSKINPGYELLNDLNEQLIKTQILKEQKQVAKFKTAVNFCENRIKLLNIQLDLLRIKIMRSLQLNWSPTTPETQLCASEQLLLDYDRIMLCYADKQFTVAIKSYYTRTFVENRSVQPPPEELLRGLIYLADYISVDDHNTLIDLIARRWARLTLPLI